MKRWFVPLLVILAIVAAVVWFVPLFPDDETTAPSAPDFGSTVTIENPRLVLPPEAGEPARIYFDISNTGESNVYIAEVAIEHGDETTLARTEGPVADNLANMPINQGQTVVFGPDSDQAILTDYDSSVVPGAEVRMRLTFGNAETVTVPMEVYAPEAIVPDS